MQTAPHVAIRCLSGSSGIPAARRRGEGGGDGAFSPLALRRVFSRSYRWRWMRIWPVLSGASIHIRSSTHPYLVHSYLVHPPTHPPILPSFDRPIDRSIHLSTTGPSFDPCVRLPTAVTSRHALVKNERCKKTLKNRRPDDCGPSPKPFEPRYLSGERATRGTGAKIAR